MISKAHNTHAIKDIYDLPDNQWTELTMVTGYSMTSSSRKHQKISDRFFTTITQYIDATVASHEPYISLFAVSFNVDDKTRV